MPPKLLRVYPNPFAHLDHQGIPAGTYAFDPIHGHGSRGWVGATVDRSKTGPIPTDGDLQMTIRTKTGAPSRTVNVDRAPRKRIVFTHAVDAPTPVPDMPHYRFGIRSGDLIIGDAATAAVIGVPFVDPRIALKTAAAKAIAKWEATYSEPPPTATWPPNLRRVAGLEAAAPAAATVATVLAKIPALATAAEAAGEGSFTLATWDPGNTGESALYGAVVGALTAAGLVEVSEGVTRVGGAPKAHSIVVSLADLAQAQAQAAKKVVTPTVPAWLQVETPAVSGGAS